MTWYGRNIDEYRDLYGKVDVELAARQRAVTGMEDTDIVSTDLWPYSRPSPAGPASIFVFKLSFAAPDFSRL